MITSVVFCFDAGKLIKGKKRHVLVDTQGLLLHGITAADVQDAFVIADRRSCDPIGSVANYLPGPFSRLGRRKPRRLIKPYVNSIFLK